MSTRVVVKVTLGVFQSKPLKGLCRIPVHRQYFDVIESNGLKISSECFDPLRVVMSHSDALR